MNTAIFGGTFNPFHLGHLEMLKAVSDLEFIDRILLIPDHIPPHKETDYLADDIHRLNMCNIICKDFPKAEVSSIEVDRKGKSYTIDTVKELKNLYPNDNFYFVCGGDMIAILDKWYNFEELFKNVVFLSFTRNDKADFLRDVEKMKQLGAEIIVIDTPIPDISSTDFRNTLKRELLPKKIYNYIKEKGLYNA